MAGQSLDAYKVPVELTLPGVFGGGQAALALQLAIATFTLFIAFRCRRQGPKMPIVAGTIGSLLVTPFIHSQDLTLLLPAGWLYLRTQPGRWERAAAVVAFIATMLLGAPLVLGIIPIAWALARHGARRWTPTPAVQLTQPLGERKLPPVRYSTVTWGRRPP